MYQIDRKTISFRNVSEIVKDKLIRISFTMLLKKLCRSGEGCDPVRKIFEVKFARKIKVDKHRCGFCGTNYLKFKVEL